MTSRKENKRKPTKLARVKSRPSAILKPRRLPPPIRPVATALPPSYPARHAWPPIFPFAQRVENAIFTDQTSQLRGAAEHGKQLKSLKKALVASKPKKQKSGAGPREDDDGKKVDEKPEQPQLKANFALQVFSGNPFLEIDPRYSLWETNARYAAEEIARMDAATLNSMPSNTAAPDQFLEWLLTSASGFFDIIAERLLIFVIYGPDTVPAYENFLTGYIEQLLAGCAGKSLSGLKKERVSFELALRYKQRKAHWIAEALKLVRNSENAGESLPTGQNVARRQETVDERNELERTAVETRTREGKTPLRKSPASNRSPSEAKHPKSAGASNALNDAASTRRAFVMPILEQKGLSALQFAAMASVDYKTVTAFLSGKGHPRSSTRKQMAVALDVNIVNFPE